MGEQEPVFWLMRSIQYIDYSIDIFIKEAMLVMHYSKGGLDLKEIERMPFDIFEKFVDEANRIQDLMSDNKDPEIRKGE